MIHSLVKNFFKFAKETSYVWMTSLLAYGASAIQSDMFSDIVIICD